MWDNSFTFQYGATSTDTNLIVLPYILKFTFQYGATSTNFDRTGEALTNAFTFQYGATSTLIHVLLFALFIYLHSNMVLLLLA